MTLKKHAYVIVWPEQLVSIGEALAQADLDTLRVQVERFPSPEVALFYRSDPSEPDYFTRITAYRVVMPLLYYLLQFEVRRDLPPFDPYRVCHDIQALSVEDLARLGIRIATGSFPGNVFGMDPGSVFAASVADKQAILRQLQHLDLPFRYPDRVSRRVIPSETGSPLDALLGRLIENPIWDQAWCVDEVPGVTGNPFNYLLVQLIQPSSRDQAWSFGLLDQALQMGAVMDATTLYQLGRANEAWYRHLSARMPSEVVLEACGLSNSEQREICASPQVITLIRGGRLAPPERSGKDGWLQVALSIQVGTPERARFVTWLVREGGQDVNHRGENLSSPLKLAVYHREPELTQCLIDLGADLDLEDYRGDTPLHWAAWLGYAELVERLVRNGADTQVRNHRGKTPKEVAEDFQQTTIMRFLTDSAISDRKRDQ
ncbi:hypothetical protein CCR95_00095 [Thiocystis minor]|uniref:ankyrin repeat domain-containing protein n=1 Tax=Thiocystis minor TaxID=61597 RepID=UPI001913F8D6|nr:ankyrin repeat domain-containing protein [Thiocystis minor]MBK5962553.1 hypothetical protein [Thiocystis minor]